MRRIALWTMLGFAAQFFGCGTSEPVPTLSRDATASRDSTAIIDSEPFDAGGPIDVSFADATSDASADGEVMPDAGPSDGARPDAMPGPDGATPRDGAAPDARLNGDAEAPDSRPQDARPLDANTPDANTPDATTPDAAAPDAIAQDAGAPDAQALPDATAPDAASPSDAGPADASGPLSCQRTADCTSPQICGGPTSCGGSVCFRCMTRTGTRTLSSPCTDSQSCATGVCDGVRHRCSAACTTGTGGDVDCFQVGGAGELCTELTVTIGAMSARLGYCAQRCNRNADCTAPDVCQGLGNLDAHRVDQACGPPRAGTSGFDATCMSGADCATAVCLTYTMAMTTTRRCTAFCASTADCGGAQPNCGNVGFQLPGGGTQSARVCTP